MTEVALKDKQRQQAQQKVYSEKRILSWLISPVHILLFGCNLVVTHVLVTSANALFGERGFNAVLKLHNIFHILNMKLAGTRIEVEFEQPLPEKGPIIYVANHQSMYDIPFLIWFLRERMPHFIAKVELRTRIPFISYALRNGGHLIIDRGDRRSSIAAIQSYGRQIESNSSAVCIFPEGTRARDGVLKPFKTGGLSTLLENMPTASVIPVTLDGTWRLVRDKLWPIPFGQRVTLRVHKPLDSAELPHPELIDHCFNVIQQSLEEIRGENQRSKA